MQRQTLNSHYYNYIISAQCRAHLQQYDAHTKGKEQQFLKMSQPLDCRHQIHPCFHIKQGGKGRT